jgi:hypothetical protein
VRSYFGEDLLIEIFLSQPFAKRLCIVDGFLRVDAFADWLESFDSNPVVNINVDDRRTG